MYLTSSNDALLNITSQDWKRNKYIYNAIEETTCSSHAKPKYAMILRMIPKIQLYELSNIANYYVHSQEMPPK